MIISASGNIILHYLHFPMEEHLKYMKEALREAAAAAAEDEVPVGAVVVCRGRIIARGHNMTERLKDPTAHAEMIAITAATEATGGKYLTDCTLYVTVESPGLLHPKTEIIAGVLAEECGALVSDFFKKKRKQ